jgi:hypothetical protein
MAVALMAASLAILPTQQASASARPTSCSSYEKLAAEVGWPRKEIKHLSYIMARESSCFARAWNKKDPYGGSYGLMQINGSNKGFLQRKTIVRKFMTELWQPRRNLVAALALWRECGWACWGTRSSRP